MDSFKSAAADVLFAAKLMTKETSSFELHKHPGTQDQKLHNFMLFVTQRK